MQPNLLHSWLAFSLVLQVTFVSRAAEDPNVALAAAEQAYRRVDPSATYELACGALLRGHATVQQSLRLRVLCGISAAALGKDEEARNHFVVALALQPDLQLGQELSPKLRNPYLEAQGIWAGVGARILLRSVHSENPLLLRFSVTDPMQLGATINVYLRARGSARYRLIETKTSATVTASLPDDLVDRPLQYYAVLLDENGNALAELGSAADPIAVLPTRPHRERARRDATTLDDRATGATQSRALWLPISLLAAGALSAGAGVYFNVQRENKASTWNGSDCEQPGRTRLQQCAGVDADRASAERAAIALYAAGGVLVTTGLAILTLGGGGRSPASSTGSAKQPAVSCGAGSSLTQVFCVGHF